MPGYTHLQRAMPSSWGLWFSSYAESFIDNEMKMTDKVYALVNEGTPFRDAYNQVKNSNDLSQFSETTRSNYSEGSPGNLKLNVLEKRLHKQR